MPVMQLPMLVVVLVLVMLLLRLVLPSLRLGLSKWLCLRLMRALPVFQLLLELVFVYCLCLYTRLSSAGRCSSMWCRVPHWWCWRYRVAPTLVRLLTLEECQVCVLLVVSACGL